MRALIKRWLPLLTRFLGVNGAVQLLGLITGILVVRALPKVDYGYYSVITGLLAAFVLISDSGLAGVVLGKGGALVDDHPRLSVVFATALRLQKQIAVLVSAVGIGALAFLLAQLGSDVGSIVAACAAFALSCIPLANKSIYQAFHRLTRGYARLQTVALVSAVVRVAATAALAYFTALNFFVLLAMNVGVAVLEAAIMRYKVSTVIDLKVPSDKDLDAEFKLTMRRTLPMSLTLVMQTQFLFFLLGVLGNATVLAEVAALSRFSVVLAVFGPIIGDVGAGVVARAAPQTRVIVSRFALILGVFLGIGAVIVGALAVFATPITWLLGSQYQGLEGPFVVIAIGTLGIMFSDAFRVLNQARGWTKWSWIYVPCSVTWALLGIFVFDLTSISHAALWMALQAFTGLITQSVVFLVGLRRTRATDV